MPQQHISDWVIPLTLGRLTLGTMTSFKAEGASLRALEVSPPGWYWYLASPPVFQGSESGAMLTGFSDEEEVGLREKCQPARPKAPDMMVRRIWKWLSVTVIALLVIGLTACVGKDGGGRRRVRRVAVYAKYLFFFTTKRAGSVDVRRARGPCGRPA